MGAYYDIVAGLKMSWQKFRNPDVLKWSLIISVLVTAYAILQTFGRADAGLSLLLFGVLIVYLLIVIYCNQFLQRAAMKAVGVKTTAKPQPYLNWLVLNIRVFLVNISSWYDKKLLLALVLGVVLSVSGLLRLVAGGIDEPPQSFIVSLMMMLTGLAIWTIILTVQSARTRFAEYMYLRGDGKEGEMPRRSNERVVGQTFEVFLALFLATLLVNGPVFVIGFVIEIIGGFLNAFIGAGTLTSVTILVILVQVLVFPFQVVGTAMQFVILADIFRFYDQGGSVAKEEKTSKKAKENLKTSKTKKK